MPNVDLLREIVAFGANNSTLGDGDVRRGGGYQLTGSSFMP